ncbi:MAG: hypothetical protein A2Y38_26625 [Spirochaetes bacterium GWB1_59_5]|nr:MAG: hypothetical protein A2Y38_26625 [Spirochaetes bacterium GWB1_59_5]
MRVIGTAGHVDHGKTALIQAMTGIDADRLPEEKARGMTTDLGFAWYAGENGEAIGVVDVPGHERYLRNMVAGAWGLDLAVLVVAADDGWMPQSTLHASIVAALAAPAVVIAVTKTDAVEPERAAFVASDAVKKASALFGLCPVAVLVSNKTGEGIAELKAAIDSALARLPPATRSGAYLYVDRVFSPLGGGTVVTGTLVNGGLRVGDELRLLPRGETVRVRGIQSYHERIDRAEPTCRAAVSLTGLKGDIERGDLLAAPDADIVCGTEFLCRLLPLPGSTELCPQDPRGRPAIRSGIEAEFAVGSAWRDAELWPQKPADFVRITTRSPVACPAGDAFVLLRRGGAELLGRGLVLRAGNIAPEDRKALATALPRAAAAAEKMRASGLAQGAIVDSVAIEVFYRGCATAPAGLSAESAADAGLIPAASPTDGTLYLFDPSRWEALRKALLAAAAEPGGLAKATGDSMFAAIFGTVTDPAGNPAGLEYAFEAAMNRMEAEKTITKNGALWTIPGATRNLSIEERAVLSRLAAAGKAGLEPGKTAPQTDARALKALCSFGEAMPLDTGMFFSRVVFDDCVAAILHGRRSGDRFTVTEAKERSGLSRKYILPLLNRMETRGLVKRSGDERVVL